ncbi:MAG: metFprotein [Rhodospirillaceae bacterium]|nr:metFprotein [Rhodospirillaceae bacterium]
MVASAKQIASILEGFSLEVTPASASKVDRFEDFLPRGTSVNVTFLPGANIQDTIDVSQRLSLEGFNPVPHIAARNFETEYALEEFLDKLVSKANVSEVLVIAGGISKPMGPYANSMQILSSGLLEKYKIKKLGVAGHPEGSPDISSTEIHSALREKNDWAQNSNIDVYIATQFCFEANPIISWEQKIRRAGNKLPIHIGLPGLATLKTLLKFAQSSGIGPSIRVLRRQSKNVAKLILIREPDVILSKLADSIAIDPNSLISKIHFYPFGGIAKTAAWATAVHAGKIEIGRLAGFKVCEKD